MRARVAAAAAVLIATAAASPAARAADVGVGIQAKRFAPARVTVVVGDAVVWRNSDHEGHDPVASDGAFSSAPLAHGDTFRHLFTGAGSHPYVCRLHTFMTGEVTVVPVLLDTPERLPTQGGTLALTGRAPAATTAVTLERADGPAAPFAPVATVAPGPDGAFSYATTATRSGLWRAALAGDPAATSPVVDVPVLGRQELLLRVRPGRSLVTLDARTRPARPGDELALQLYSPERFAWRQVAHGRLDAQGRMLFTLRRGVRRLARLAYRPAGGPVVTSGAVRLPG